MEEFNARYNPLRSSLVIASGYGCYPFLLLKEPFLVTTPDDRRLLDSYTRRFHQALHDIACAHGWTGAVDYCDLAKVLRLPGCLNWKNPQEPKVVRVVHDDPEARFNLIRGVLPTAATTPSANVIAMLRAPSRGWASVGIGVPIWGPRCGTCATLLGIVSTPQEEARGIKDVVRGILAPAGAACAATRSLDF